MKDSNSEGNETIALSRPFHYWPIKLVNLAKKVPNRNAIMLYFCSKDDLHFFPPQSVNNDIAYLKTNIQSIEAQWGYIQSFSFPFLKIIFYFFISGTLDSCPNTKTIGDRCKFTETHTSCIKSSAIESTSQLPEEGHFCQNGESSYAQCNGGCLDENNSKYKLFLIYLF